MADWFKFFNDGLEEPRFQFAISEQPLVASVWLVILSEASKKRSCKITWRDQDFELFGYARKINISVPVLNQCIGILERIGYISRKNGFIEVPGWELLQSDYAKGLSKGYYKTTSKTLASNSLDSTVRGEKKIGEENSDKASNKAKKLSVKQVILARRIEACLDGQWVNDAGKWVNRVKERFEKTERVCAELESAIKEGRVVASPAEYAEYTWKDFK